MVCCGTILGFIVSKKKKTPDPKKIEVLVKMPMPKTPQEIQVFNGMTQYYRCLVLQMHQSPSYSEKLKCSNGLLNVKPLGKISRTSTFKFLY
jgi:hypothetical protein